MNGKIILGKGMKMMKKVLCLFAIVCLVAASLAFPGGSSWTNIAHAAGTTYYLSPDGDNSNDGTSPSTPWKTLKRAAYVLEAGDSLLLMGGTYVSDPANNEFFFSPPNSGTAGDPITIKAYNGQVPIISGASPYGSFITLVNVSHYVVEGLHFENTTNGFPIYSMDADDITIRNCVFLNTNDSQMVVHGSHLVIENNVFDTAGDPSGEGSGDNLYLIGTTYSLVQNNYFTKGGHYSVDVIDREGDPKTFAHHNVIRNNYIDQHWGGGIGVIRGTTQTVVENNFIKNAGVEVLTYPKTGIQVAAEQNIVRNNIITLTGPELNFDEGMAVESYRFSGIDQNVRDNRIYNNNIYKSGRDAIFFSQRGATEVTRNKFANNIFYHNRTTGDYNEYWPAGNYYFTVETYHAFADNKWPNYPNDNYMYNNEILHADANGDHPGEPRLFYYDQEGWGKSLAEVEADYPAYIHDNVGDNPQYVNADGDDFSLQSGSPMIDAGAHLAQTTSAGTNTTVVPVNDPWFFSDGYGVVSGDSVKIGSNALVTVTSLDTAANSITVDTPITFAGGDNVDVAYYGSSADIGAIESGDTPWTPVQYFPTAGDGQVTLKWGTVSGAAGYKVKYGTSAGSYTTTVDVGDTTSTAITGLANDTLYYFAVSAYNANGESADSFEKYGIPHILPPAPEAPAQNAPAAGDGQVTVSWSGVSGADGYNVKYGTSTGSYTTTVNAGKATGKTITGLTNGTTYYFVVTAFNAGGESAISNEQSAVPQVPPAPGAPVQNAPTAGDGQVTVHWAGVDGAAGYKVEYGTSSGSYTATVDAGNATSRTITGLINGTTYYFVVSAYNSGGESALSNEQSAAPQPAPEAPVINAPIAGDGQVTVSWSGVGGAAGYKVKYGTSSGAYTATKDVGSATSTVITDLVNDTTYYFVVAAYNALGSESNNSAERSAIPQSADGSKTATLKNGVNGYSGSYSFEVRSENPDAHNGSESYGHWVNPFPGRNFYAIRAFYKFDLSPAASGIPANATVESAQLKLYVNYGAGSLVNAYRMAPVNDAFTLDYLAATHDTYDGIHSWTGGANAAGDPADVDNDFADTPDEQVTPTSTGEYMTFDVTQSAQAWHSGTPNNGWMVNTAEGSAQFGTAGDLYGPTHYPVLVVKYTVPPAPDVTFPTTQAVPEGTLGAEDWYVSDVTVTLTAADDRSGIASTEYAVGQSGYLRYASPVVISEGVYDIRYRSTDNAGNVEPEHLMHIQIDKTAPTFSITGNGQPLMDGAVFEDSEPVTLDLQAADHMSGLQSQAVIVDGTPYEPGTSLDWAGQLGAHAIRISVTDQAGNTSETAIQVNIGTNVASMRQLLERFVGSGELDGPLLAQLTDNLDEAADQWDKGHKNQAVKYMQDFLKHMENAALQEHISAHAKQILTADANALIQLWSK